MGDTLNMFVIHRALCPRYCGIIFSMFLQWNRIYCFINRLFVIVWTSTVDVWALNVNILHVNVSFQTMSAISQRNCLSVTRYLGKSNWRRKPPAVLTGGWSLNLRKERTKAKTGGKTSVSIPERLYIYLNHVISASKKRDAIFQEPKEESASDCD